MPGINHQSFLDLLGASDTNTLLSCDKCFDVIYKAIYRNIEKGAFNSTAHGSSPEKNKKNKTLPDELTK